MATQVFQFKTNPGLQQATQVGVISIDEIMKMSSAEFLSFQNQLMYVRRRTRYDTAVYPKAIIPAETRAYLFRKGEGDSDTLVGTSTAYAKTRAHTNMPRKGEFPQGALVIITDVIAKKAFFSSVPTTVVNGIPTNTKAITQVASNDPALNLAVWLEQIELAYREDANPKVINYLGKFTQNEGISGFIGNSVGGIAQNFAAQGIALPAPRVIEGSQDFDVEIHHLADFDTSTATGIDQFVVQRVELETIELIADRP